MSLPHSILRPVPASAVYAAEDQWSAVLDRGGSVDFFGSRLDVSAQRRFGDIDSIRRYVEAVVALPAVVARYPAVGPVTVRERAGQSKAHYEAQTSTIAIPMKSTWAARESVILHEVAHHLVGSSKQSTSTRHQWHGVGFRQAMCLLAQAVLGSEAALLLRAGYEEAGLRTVEPT